MRAHRAVPGWWWCLLKNKDKRDVRGPRKKKRDELPVDSETTTDE
jgi:hypothetical protein